ncbi:hypothetical protein BH11PAT2_BH11PAT2_03950 [soil metagenome]
MKKILVFLAFLLIIPFTSHAAVHVNGYFKKNGTYVAPYYRSSPDSSPYNNYSYPGNTNPYTGKTATGNADTYLNNYYNRSTGTTNSTYIPTTYTPTTNIGTYSYTPTSSYTVVPQTYTPKTLPTATVPYTVKLWSDNNPTVGCNQSTFLRNAEKVACNNYRNNLSSYTWTQTTNEYDGIHYYYNATTGVTTSCPDGYAVLFSTSTGQLAGCRIDS